MTKARTANIGLASTLADGINISFGFAIHLLFRAEKALFIFCTYLRLRFATGRDVRAESTLNASAAASPTVGGNIDKPLNNGNSKKH